MLPFPTSLPDSNTLIHILYWIALASFVGGFMSALGRLTVEKLSEIVRFKKNEKSIGISQEH